MKKFYKYFLVGLFGIIPLGFLYSQCGFVPLTVNNPSFEGPTQPHVTPPGWDICMPGTTPDTQPGSWGITLPPTNGSSYLGLVHDPSITWQEGAGQTLSSAMVAGTNYSFTIDLATTNINGSGITPGPVELQLWGGWAGGNGCSQVELLWHSGNVTNLTWQTRTLAFTPSANYTHILFLIQSLGSGAPYIMLDNMTPIIPASDVPYYTYSSTASNGSFCPGVNVQFTDSSYSPAGNTILSWSWDFGDGTPIVTARNTTHTFTNPGTYHVTLEITDNVPCTFTFTRDIVVNPFPTVNFTTDSACIGAAITFTNTSTLQGNPLTPTTFVWDYGDGNTNNSILNPSYIYTNSGQFNATFFVTENGCSGSISHPVTVFPYPVVNLGPDQSICTGTNLRLDAGNAGSTYHWQDNNTGRFYDVTQAGNYSVTVTSGQNCTSSDDVNIAFYPGTQISVTPSDSVLCKGDSLTVTVTGSNQIQWHPGRWLSDSTGTSVLIKPYSSTLYTVIGRNMYNCYDTAFVRIIANSWPNTDLGPDLVFCNLSSYILKGNSQDYTYEWPDGSTSSVFTVNEPGKYWVRVNNKGCIRTDTIEIFPCVNIYVPNAFSPDDNLLNDWFSVVPNDTIRIANFNFYILDRWGGTIFQTETVHFKWDGTKNGEKCPSGVYGWKMIFAVKGIDGRDILFEKHGSVTLIR